MPVNYLHLSTLLLNASGRLLGGGWELFLPRSVCETNGAQANVAAALKQTSVFYRHLNCSLLASYELSNATRREISVGQDFPTFIATRFVQISRRIKMEIFDDKAY